MRQHNTIISIKKNIVNVGILLIHKWIHPLNIVFFHVFIYLYNLYPGKDTTLWSLFECNGDILWWLVYMYRYYKLNLLLFYDSYQLPFNTIYHDYSPISPVGNNIKVLRKQNHVFYFAYISPKVFPNKML